MEKTENLSAQARYVTEKLEDAKKAVEELTQKEMAIPEILQTLLEIMNELQDVGNGFQSIVDQMQNYLYAADEMQRLAADFKRDMEHRHELQELQRQVLQRLNVYLDRWV